MLDSRRSLRERNGPRIFLRFVREALLTRKTADLLIRPRLTVNGTPVSLKLLEDVKLTISSTDLDGMRRFCSLSDSLC